MPDTHVVTIDGEQFIVYDSENTGQQLDAGIRKLAGLDADIQAAAEAAAAAKAAQQAAASSQTAAAASASTAAGQHGHHKGVGSGVQRVGCPAKQKRCGLQRHGSRDQ